MEEYQHASPLAAAAEVPCIDPDASGPDEVPAFMRGIQRLWHDLTSMTKSGLTAAARARGIPADPSSSKGRIARDIMSVAELCMLRWAACHAHQPCLRGFAVSATPIDRVLGDGIRYGTTQRLGPWRPREAFLSYGFVPPELWAAL
jgi:hypothetical protein